MNREIRKGFGPLVVLRDRKGELLMLPHVEEGIPKQEVWMYQGDKMEVRGYEFPGGACDGDETMEETAVREVREEAKLRVNSGRLERIGVGGVLEQDRGRKLIHFGIELFELKLNLIEELWIRLFKGAKNRHELFENEIRVRDLGALRLLDEYYACQAEGEM